MTEHWNRLPRELVESPALEYRQKPISARQSRVVGRVTTMTQRNRLASNFINWRIPQTDKLSDLTSLTNEQRRFGNGAIFRASRSQTCIYILEKQRKREEKQEKERRREEERERKSITSLGSRDDDDRRGNPPVVGVRALPWGGPSLLLANPRLQLHFGQTMDFLDFHPMEGPVPQDHLAHSKLCFSLQLNFTEGRQEVFQPSDHFRGPPLDPLQQVHVFLVLGTPELEAVLQVGGSHQSRVEGQNHLPRPAGHASFDAAQDTVGLLGCEHTLLAHVQLFVHQYPQVLLCRTALNPFIPQPVWIPGVAPTQVQDLALGLVEPHEVRTGPRLQPVKVPLDGIPSLRHVNCTTQLGVICKLAEGALNPTVYVIDEDIKQDWSQYGPLRDTTCHRSPSGQKYLFSNSVAPLCRLPPDCRRGADGVPDQQVSTHWSPLSSLPRVGYGKTNRARLSAQSHLGRQNVVPKIGRQRYFNILRTLKEDPSVVGLLKVEEQQVPIATMTVHWRRYRTNRDSLIPIHKLTRQLENQGCTSWGPLSSPARQRAACQDLPLSRDASQGYSSRLRDSLPQQILVYSHSIHDNLEVSVAVDKSMLQQVHLEASVAVHEVMLEHLKACGHG
ncbi:hypothetical protein QYF61_001078 [Mycteria americana]|uniref:Uncharacterized protein n=1 Tax=Mycteria americana TaxID=33587 RepID=A0AAN7N1B3_MYCAM|nr:hypothetical protein QYF61_001074 [Mycteria americana]KAK4806155.1 hypothetical protein QYF61_001078 [Mycteria americana]